MLNRRGELLDIDTDDLESLLRDVQLQAYARTFNELTCADIMSRSSRRRVGHHASFRRMESAEAAPDQGASGH